MNIGCIYKPQWNLFYTSKKTLPMAQMREIGLGAFAKNRTR